MVTIYMSWICGKTEDDIFIGLDVGISVWLHTSCQRNIEHRSQQGLTRSLNSAWPSTIADVQEQTKVLVSAVVA